MRKNKKQQNVEMSCEGGKKSVEKKRVKEEIKLRIEGENEEEEEENQNLKWKGNDEDEELKRKGLKEDWNLAWKKFLKSF